MFKNHLQAHLDLFSKIDKLEPEVSEFVESAQSTLESGGKLIFAGNGGSAGDAQHIATEFTVKFRNKRPALPAISLATDTSALTAIGNDFGFDQIFSRQLEAIGKEGDLIVLISTSGQSKNLIECARVAKSIKVVTFGLLGCDGGKLKNLCDHSIVMPETDTARIQEAHIFILHYLISSVEGHLFNEG